MNNGTNKLEPCDFFFTSCFVLLTDELIEEIKRTIHLYKKFVLGEKLIEFGENLIWSVLAIINIKEESTDKTKLNNVRELSNPMLFMNSIEKERKKKQKRKQAKLLQQKI